MMLKPITITADEIASIRNALASHDPSLIPQRFRFDDVEPWEFLFKRLVTLFEGSLEATDAGDTLSYSILRGPKSIAVQFGAECRIKLIDAVRYALYAFERTAPKDSVLSSDVYKELLEDAALAVITGLSREAYESLSPEMQAAADSGEFSSRSGDSEEDDIQFWDPVTDPDYGR